MITNAGEQSVAITVEHVIKRFGEFPAVNDVSFSVKPGKRLGCWGQMGLGRARSFG